MLTTLGCATKWPAIRQAGLVKMRKASIPSGIWGVFRRRDFATWWLRTGVRPFLAGAVFDREGVSWYNFY